MHWEMNWKLSIVGLLVMIATFTHAQIYYLQFSARSGTSPYQLQTSNNHQYNPDFAQTTNPNIPQQQTNSAKNQNEFQTSENTGNTQWSEGVPAISTRANINSFQYNMPSNLPYPPSLSQYTNPNIQQQQTNVGKNQAPVNSVNSQAQEDAQDMYGKMPANQPGGQRESTTHHSTIGRVPLESQNIFLPGNQAILPNSDLSPQTVPAARPAQSNQHSSGSIGNSNFYSRLFLTIAAGDYRSNILFSPLSLELVLALVNIGGMGQTKQQILQALSLPDNNIQIANHYQALQMMQHATPDSQLIMANKLYVDTQLGELKEDFQNLAKLGFNAEIESINFGQPQYAAKRINQWVAEKTLHRIHDIITPSDLQGNTEGILINAIYFKAKWAIEFSTVDTTIREFFVTPNQPVNIDMMYNDDVFRYAEVPELGAKILELPYVNSNMTMTFILPNTMNALPELEQRLNAITWSELWTQLKPQQVAVRIPKFRVEYKVDMIQPLQQLGVTRVFSNDAELTNILKNRKGLRISKIQHRAVIDVNEAGSEAAATSFAKFVPLSLPLKLKTFTANHPFIYMIRSPETVHFIGHFVKPN